MRSQWPPAERGTAEKKWEVMRTALVVAAEGCLGFEKRKQPDWFRESSTSLKPLLQLRNGLYSKWLSSRKKSETRRDLQRHSVMPDRQ